MKYIASYFILNCLLVTISCQSQKSGDPSSTMNFKKENINKIELTESTRGTNRTVTYSNTAIVTDVNCKTTSLPISETQWENIVKEARLINLERISIYESPTTKRYSDAAMSSKVIISVEDNKYSSADFDAGTPPKELELLYQKLQQARGTDKNKSKY